MKPEDILKIQAWMDGELSASAAKAVEQLVAQDAEAKAIADELRWTKAALATGEVERKVPESREFYWSKIERAIRVAEPSGAIGLRRHAVAWWLRWAAPAGIAAALALLIFLPTLRRDHSEQWISGAEIESPLNDVSSITFRSEAEGVTVVWISTH